MNMLNAMNIPKASNSDVNKDKDKDKDKEATPGCRTFQKFCEMGETDRIDMDEFWEKGIYSREEVERDKERVRKIKASPDYKKPTNASIALENILNQWGELKDWFSDSTKNESYCFRLSEFDDIIKDAARGDMAIEVRLSNNEGNENDETMCLLIDATTAADEGELVKKRRKCLNEIENGRLHTVKYFKSQLTEKMGREENLPMVVAGIDADSLDKLCVRYEQGIKPEKDYVQIIILEEIVKQLSFFYVVSKKANGEDHFVTKRLLKPLEFFSETLRTKKSLRPVDFEEKADKEDKVFEYINREFTNP